MGLRVHAPAVAALFVVLVGCTEADEPSRGIVFPTSCADTTQSLFEKGLFLLHNMMYEQATAEFESAARADAKCAMLHWGIAMSQFHPQWPGEPTQDALATGAAAVAAGLAITAGTTDRERGYLAAVGAYYEDWRNNDRAARKASWREAQRNHATIYTDDSEAQIFAALAELTTSDPYDKSYSQQLKAAESLEKILREHPEHPGLMHYLLHAYDNPVYARRGVSAAERYESVAPDAPHALHMPSHIYVRLGNWKKVISWNIRSRDSARRQPSRGGKISRHYLHALDYLVYGYLQAGDDRRAREEAVKSDAHAEWQLDSGPAAYALSAVPARFALERRAWSEAAALEPRAVPYSWDRYPWAEAITHAARGLGAVRVGDVGAAQRSIAELERLEGLTANRWWRGRIRLEKEVISGWIAHRQGNARDAVERIRQAAEQELAAGKLSVEPGHTMYAIEELGELLLELERPEEALEAFQRSLQDSPSRFHSLFGAGRAAEAAGRNELAVDYYSALTDKVTNDTGRPQAKHAADFLAKRTR